MKRRFITLTIVAIMTLSFVACGEASKVEDNQKESSIEYNKEEKNEEEKDETEEEGEVIDDNNDETLNENESLNEDEALSEDENNENEEMNEEIENLEENNSIESEAINYLNYYNSRYGFRIQYPDFLIEQPAPTNSDGRVFTSEDGKIKLTASGSNNILGYTVESEYNSKIAKLPNISYSNLGKRSYVVSWEEGSIIFYMCEIIGPGSINTFVLEYPKERAEELSEVVGVCYDSFTAGDLESIH